MSYFAEQMNKVVYKQGREIDRLKDENDALRQEIDDLHAILRDAGLEKETD